MNESNDVIEIFDNEDGIITEQKNSSELYDIKGNLITVDDEKNNLPDNTDLIQKAIDGDKQAFNELYMQSYRYVFFVVRQYIPDDETTYDAIQEVFIKVYKNISTLRSPSAYYSWITSIAKNTAIDILRTKHFETNLSYEEKDETVLDKQTEKDVSLDIETVLKKLDPQDADLLSLVYYDGMRISQIAKMQCVPKTTVYSRFNKAKKNLKAQLKVHGIDKAIYSGNFVAMITTAIRNIIGTALLSFVIAQQILNSIIGKKSKKELVVAKIIKAHQKKLALKIASCIVAIAIFTSCFTVLALTDWGRAFTRNVKDTIVETITEYHYYTDSSSDKNDTENKDDGGFWQNLFGGNSSKNDDGSEESNTSSGNFWQNLFGGGKDDSDNTSSTSSESKGFWESLFGSDDKNSSENSSDDNSSDLNENEDNSSSDNTTSENQTTSDDQTSGDGPQSGSGGTSTPTTSTPATSVPSHTPPASTPPDTTPNTPTIPAVPDGFVADCDVSEYNVLGNEFSNYNVAMQGDWIYYCAATYSGEEGYGLYKVKKDGTQKQHLRNWPNAIDYNYINVVGPWIYYISGGKVRRMLTDGTGDESLGGSNVTTLQVYGDYAYFKFSQSQSSNGGFKKMNLNTLEISDCNQVYFTDKYRICVEYDTSDNDNDRYAIYNLKTGALAATISMDYGSIGKCYNSALLIGKYVFSLTNLNAEPVNFHVNITDYKKTNYFYSPYKGGCVGGWYGETMDGWYYDKFTGVIYMSDLSQLNWPFPWKCIDSVYGPLKTSQYAVFGDYVYYIDGAALHKILPDGTKHTVLG